MKGKLLQKALSITAAIAVSLSLAACGSFIESNGDESVVNLDEGNNQEQITLKFFSNSPDRNTGIGKLEDQWVEKYMAENPNIRIQLEALQDESYKQKFKAYTASNQLPDIYTIWGQPAFFGPVMKNGYAAELKPEDYSSYGFIKEAFNGFKYNEKLYGLPRNVDFMALYYNKGMFERNGIKVPETYGELVEAARAFRAKGIAPLAINGKDKWPIALLYQELAVKYSGNQRLIYDAVTGKTSFEKEEELGKAAQLLKELMDARLFQDSFTSADYGGASSLFAQEKAAMYYGGSWSMTMAVDKSFPDSFKQNVSAVKFPSIEGGKGKDTDMLAWCGAGYAVASNSANRDEAVKFLNYIFKPENMAKGSWQTGTSFPAQDFSPYLTGGETELQKQLTEIFYQISSSSGVAWMDSAAPAFKNYGESLSQELAAGVLTPRRFLTECDKAAAKSAGR